MVSSQCFVSEHTWVSVGWSLLKSKADYRRDCLLPAPSRRYKGCVLRELRYDAASAVQTSIRQTLHVKLLFRDRGARYWTPQSPRNFLPSSAFGAGCAEGRQGHARRLGSGGSAAEERERYARVSQYRITSVQGRVVHTFSGFPEAGRGDRSQMLQEPQPVEQKWFCCPGP